MTDLGPREWQNQYQRQEQLALVDLESTAASAETEVWTRQSSKREGSVVVYARQRKNKLTLYSAGNHKTLGQGKLGELKSSHANSE
jgi:hypothetical protein